MPSFFQYDIQGSYSFIKYKFKDFSKTICHLSRTENYFYPCLIGGPPRIIVGFENEVVNIANTHGGGGGGGKIEKGLT